MEAVVALYTGNTCIQIRGRLCHFSELHLRRGALPVSHRSLTRSRPCQQNTFSPDFIHSLHIHSEFPWLSIHLFFLHAENWPPSPRRRDGLRNWDQTVYSTFSILTHEGTRLSGHLGNQWNPVHLSQEKENTSFVFESPLQRSLMVWGKDSNMCRQSLIFILNSRPVAGKNMPLKYPNLDFNVHKVWITMSYSSWGANTSGKERAFS